MARKDGNRNLGLLRLLKKWQTRTTTLIDDILGRVGKIEDEIKKLIERQNRLSETVHTEARKAEHRSNSQTKKTEGKLNDLENQLTDLSGEVEYAFETADAKIENVRKELGGKIDASCKEGDDESQKPNDRDRWVWKVWRMIKGSFSIIGLTLLSFVVARIVWLDLSLHEFCGIGTEYGGITCEYLDEVNLTLLWLTGLAFFFWFFITLISVFYNNTNMRKGFTVLVLLVVTGLVFIFLIPTDRLIGSIPECLLISGNVLFWPHDLDPAFLLLGVLTVSQRLVNHTERRLRTTSENTSATNGSALMRAGGSATRFNLREAGRILVGIKKEQKVFFQFGLAYITVISIVFGFHAHILSDYNNPEYRWFNPRKYFGFLTEELYMGHTGNPVLQDLAVLRPSFSPCFDPDYEEKLKTDVPENLLIVVDRTFTSGGIADTTIGSVLRILTDTLVNGLVELKADRESLPAELRKLLREALQKNPYDEYKSMRWKRTFHPDSAWLKPLLQYQAELRRTELNLLLTATILKNLSTVKTFKTYRITYT